MLFIYIAAQDSWVVNPLDDNLQGDAFYHFQQLESAIDIVANITVRARIIGRQRVRRVGQPTRQQRGRNFVVINPIRNRSIIRSMPIFLPFYAMQM